MNPEAVVKFYGGTARKVAEALGVTPAAVHYWVSEKRIPYKTQQFIELHSKGKLKAKRDK